MADIIIKINVGGTIFHSTRLTLEILPYFKIMFNGNFFSNIMRKD